MPPFFILFFVSTVFLFGQVPGSPVETHGQLSVTAGKVLDHTGSPVSLAGNSFFWSNDGWGGEAFYNRGVVEHLKNDWNATIVRAVMGVDEAGGYLSAPSSNLAKVKVVIDAAIELGLYVIVDWHSHHAEMYESEAISFFTQIASEYGDHPNIIYEIYNEPLAVSWSGVIKPYAENVISAIRNIDPDNLIVVGTPNWSQDVDDAAADPINISGNIAYTIHFYAGTHRDSLRAKAQTALNAGIALFCTEWGAVSADGDGAVDAVETEKWMSFFREQSISHCNWAVNNKAEGSSAFLSSTSATGAFTDADLTTSGTLVKEIVQGWGGAYQSEAAWVRHYSEGTTGDLTVEFTEIESWNGGFNGNITITNNGAAISNYSFGFSTPWSITSFWNLESSTWSNAGGDYDISVIDHAWLSQLNTGHSVTMGFTANGEFSDPTEVLWNGAPLVEMVEDGSQSFTEWMTLHAVTGADSDDDNDGYGNLAEFLMGTVPDDASSVPALQSKIEGGYWKIQFPVDPKALNVEYRLQVSYDLLEWFAASGEYGMSIVESNESANVVGDVEWTSNSAVSFLGRKFFTRLEVREVE